MLWAAGSGLEWAGGGGRALALPRGGAGWVGQEGRGSGRLWQRQHQRHRAAVEGQARQHLFEQRADIFHLAGGGGWRSAAPGAPGRLFLTRRPAAGLCPRLCICGAPRGCAAPAAAPGLQFAPGLRGASARRAAASRLCVCSRGGPAAWLSMGAPPGCARGPMPAAPLVRCAGWPGQEGGGGRGKRANGGYCCSAGP